MLLLQPLLLPVSLAAAATAAAAASAIAEQDQAAETEAVLARGSGNLVTAMEAVAEAALRHKGRLFEAANLERALQQTVRVHDPEGC